MKKDILLVVGSATLTSVISQHLMNVDVVAFQASILGTGYRLIVVCDPLTDPKNRAWFDVAIAPRLEKNGQIVEVLHEIGVLANAPQAQVRREVVNPMPIEPIEVMVQSKDETNFVMPEPLAPPVILAASPDVVQLVQPLPVNMPILDDAGKVVIDPAVIIAAHKAPE